MNELDDARLCAALELARGSIGLSEPNPRVGCILGLSSGEVLGQGATQQAGSAHAEVMAIREAREAGHSLQGTTAWVTLEPCAHHGRTPPCCDALIEAGIARCVVALQDPFPEVAGAGLQRLRAAGVDVELLESRAPLAVEARELNIGFFSRIERGRPWVRMKLATSLDGRSALSNGISQWITGPEARADGHRWRKRASAVMTGIGTVLADNPRLDVRAVETASQPLRVVLDTHLRMPAQAAILRPPGTVLVIGSTGHAARVAALRDAGAEVWEMDVPASLEGPTRPAPGVLLSRLAERGINELHVEAGPTLSGSWLGAGYVDELLVYLAPRPAGSWPGCRRFASPGGARFGCGIRLGRREHCRQRPEAAAAPRNSSAWSGSHHLNRWVCHLIALLLVERLYSRHVAALDSAVKSLI